MSFLQKLLPYQRICIQCHNNPDADTIASAFGVHRYLSAHGVESFLVYGGALEIKKSCIKLLLDRCGIPLVHTHAPEGHDLLLMVDCQYAQGNAETFPAPALAVIDHHIRTMEEHDRVLIQSSYQSCSTLVWEMLREEGYPVCEDEALCVALLYGLYTDTSCFADLFHPADNEMRMALFDNQPLFDLLAKSSMTVAELMVASDAMHNHYFDIDHRFAIVEALSCDQSVLGIIGDFIIQVDVIYLSFTYTESGAGYQISLRTCHEKLPANLIAAFVCDGIGSGGGHARKAGGYIHRGKLTEQYGDTPVFNVVESRLRQYFEQFAPL